YDTIKGVREYCLEKQKPFLIECATFRMRGHEEASGAKYVPEHLFEIWGMKDPLLKFEQFLEEEQVLSEDEKTAIKSAVKEYIEEEVKLGFDAAKAKPEAGVELYEVYAPLSSNTAGNTDVSVTEHRELRFVDAISEALHQS